MRKEFQIQRLEGMAAGMVHVLGIIIFCAAVRDKPDFYKIFSGRL